MGLASRHRVATWLGARHEKRCRDTDLMSRHRSEVATWGRLPGAVHCFVHCSGHCLGYCLDTVHGHCS